MDGTNLVPKKKHLRFVIPTGDNIVNVFSGSKAGATDLRGRGLGFHGWELRIRSLECFSCGMLKW